MSASIKTTQLSWIIATILSVFLSSNVYAQLLYNEDFESGQLGFNAQLSCDNASAKFSVQTNTVRSGNRAAFLRNAANVGKRCEIVPGRGNSGDFYWGKEYWVGFSFNIPHNKPNAGWRAFHQHHSAAGDSWCGGLTGGNGFSIFQYGNDLSILLTPSDQLNKPAGSSAGGNQSKAYTFPLEINKWIDVVMNFRYSDTSNGFWKIWVNGQLVINRTGSNVNLFDSCGGKKARWYAMKYGIYSGITGNGDVYYDNIRIGNSSSSYNEVSSGVGAPPPPVENTAPVALNDSVSVDNTNTTSTPYDTAVRALSPLSYWRLGETSGTTATDQAGSKNGIYTGGVAQNQNSAIIGDANTSAGFDGSNDYIHIPHDSSFALNDGSFSFWLQTNNTTQSSHLISKDAYGYGTGGHFGIGLNNGKINVRIQNTESSFWLTSATELSANVWHNVVVNFGATGLSLYIDGQRQASGTYTGGIAANTEPMAFAAQTGYSDAGAITPLRDFFQGQMDEIALFNTALSASQVQALYDAGASAANSVVINVLANDTDADNDTLRIASTTQGSQGRVVNNGTQLTYIPNTNANGTDTFTYTVTDGKGGTDQASVTVTIHANQSNTAPIINTLNDINLTLGESVNVTLQGSDAEGDNLSFSLINSPTFASITNANNPATLTLAPTQTGSYTITVQVSDGALSSSQTFSLTVENSTTTAAPSIRSVEAMIRQGHHYQRVLLQGALPLNTSLWEISPTANFSQRLLHKRLQRKHALVIPLGILQPENSYWVRVRYLDRVGNLSPWSAPFQFTTPADASDSDNNGIDDRYQVDSAVDVYDNGVLLAPANLCHLYDAQESDVIGFQSNTGDINCYTAYSKPHLLEVTDRILPYGLFNFNVSQLSIDANNPAAIEVSIYFPVNLEADMQWLTFDESQNTLSNASNKTQLNGNRITLRLVDGGENDADGEVNGVIVNTSGPSPKINTQTVISTFVDSGGGALGWALLISLLLFKLYYLRRIVLRKKIS